MEKQIDAIATRFPEGSFALRLYTALYAAKLRAGGDGAEELWGRLSVNPNTAVATRARAELERIAVERKPLELAFTAVDELSEGTAAPTPSSNAPGKPATGTPAFDWEDSTLLNCDRIRPTDLDRVLEALGVTLPKGVRATGEQNQVLFARWMLDAEP